MTTKPPKGHVYFIQGKDGGLIKIGWAKDPTKRLEILQVGSPISLTLLGTTPGTRKNEKELQRKFHYARFHGEWFAPVPELLEEIPDSIPPFASSTISYPGASYWKPTTNLQLIRRRQKTQFMVHKISELISDNVHHDEELEASFNAWAKQRLREEVYLISQLEDDEEND